MVSPERSTVAEIHVIAAQTLQTIERRERFFAFLVGGKAHLHRKLAELVRLVGTLDPSGFSENDFAKLTANLSDVVDGLERYFAKHGNANDPAECQFLGQSLTRLKDARKWLAQGLSPDAEKRPSDASRLSAAKARASEAWADLLA
jgi:hypothetical protein